MAEHKNDTKKPFWKKWWFWLIIVVLIVAGIGGNSETENDSALQEESQEDTTEQETNIEQPTENDTTQTNENEQEEEITEEQTPEALDEYLEFVINDIAGEKTNLNGEYEQRVHAVHVDPESTIAEVVASDNFSTDLIRTTMTRDSAEIYERVFTEREDINKLVLTWVFPAVDAKGNEMKGTFLNVSMTRETADSINWDNFNHSNLPEVADAYVETPLLTQ